MTLNWADFALVMVIVVAGCGAGYFLLFGRLRRMLKENQREVEHHLAALTEAIRAHAPVSPESATDALTAAEMESEAAVVRAFAAPKSGDSRAAERTQTLQQQEEIAPEIRAAIAATAIAALGNHASVRSARSVPSSDVVSPWTQQGRMIVQSSHNLRTQGPR